MELLRVRVDDVVPDPLQPRKDFEPEALQELADSIRIQGLKTPISVRLHPDPGPNTPPYQIIAGERRWRAHRLAGIPFIEVLLEKGEAVTPEAVFAHQMIENIDRRDLNPVEKAEFINRRIEFHRAAGVASPGEKVASELGKSVSWISKATQILKYSPEVRGIARDGKLRDYGLLRKIDALSPARKAQALALIERGEFNSKEFFKRKRYDRKAVAAGDEAQVPAKDTGVSHEKSELVRLSLSKDLLTRLMARTDYRYLLEKEHPGWRDLSLTDLKSVFGKFLQWVEESESFS